jgi:ATP-dependent helicase/nuclease subunit B
MNAFLENIAKQILEKYPTQTDKICIILPNRRAIRFLQDSIGKEIYQKKSIWLPEMYSLTDFVYKHSDYVAADNTSLLMELFKIHRAIKSSDKQEMEEFEDFIQWGNTVLHDFNEIDMHLIDAKDIFHYLSDTKAISLWSPDENKLTDFQKRYLSFYKSLFTYYEQLKLRLKEKNIAYQGMAYRDFAEKIIADTIQFPYEKIFFCGFNALTTSEKKIIKTLHRRTQAEILFDADSYYVDNKNHEAGLFLRELKEEFEIEELKWQSDAFSEEKTIKIIGVPQNIGQTKLAGQIIKDIKQKNPKETFDDTLIIMNDENLLEPMLHAIPKEIDTFNVSIGYSLYLSPIFQFVQQIFQAYLLDNNKKKTAFFHSYVTKILLHPYSAILSGDATKLQSVTNEITTKNLSIVYKSKLKEILETQQCGDLFDQIFNLNATPIEFLKSIYNVCDTILEKAENTLSKLETESIFHLQNSINQLENNLKEHQININLSALWKLFKDSSRNNKIPLVGEPLKGLQLMGMLETRNLSFKKIIMLSVNEGLLPAGKTNNSFIPLNIKREFELPDYYRKDAIYAYHFYRLLQNAEEIHLLYNTETDNLGAREKSRFIQQLEYELPIYNKNIKIEQYQLQIKPDLHEKEWILKAEKEISTTNKAIKTKITTIFENGISPSAINTYVSCPRKFYFQYILRIREMEEVEESMDQRNIGNIIHKTLENAYTPLEGKVLKTNDIKNLLKTYKDIAEEVFEKEHFGQEKIYGKTLLMKQLALTYIKNFLHNEIRTLESKNTALSIIKLEEDLSCNIENFKLKGKADRIDRKNGNIRIIDYKTGKYDEQNDLKLPKEMPENLEDIIGNYKYSKSIQIMLYLLMYAKMKNISDIQNMQAGMYFLQYSSKGLINLKLPSYMKENSLGKIEEIILMILRDMENSNFEKYEDVEYKCKYCPFAGICN